MDIVAVQSTTCPLPEAKGNESKYIRYLILSAGIILMITALAKIISVCGHATALNESDPIFGIPFWCLMLGAGVIEMAIASICLFTSKSKLAVWLVAILSTDFVAYRVMLWRIGWHRPCACMGSLTDMLHIPADTADAGMKVVLAYLLIVSYGLLLWGRRGGLRPQAQSFN